MPSLEDLPSWPVKELVDRIGSTDAAPGGGAACGVVIALATACALKAVVMTLKHHPDDPELTTGAERLRRIAEDALHGAADDALVFKRLIAAFQLPANSPAEAEIHHAAVRQGASSAVEVGLRLKALAIEVKAIMENLPHGIAANMVSDVRTALALASAAELIQVDNIEGNRKTAG
jgi:glutamate formiminotransferase/formiminotetrahydrofolate cyclodeaminase